MDNKYLPIPIADPIYRFEPFSAYFDLLQAIFSLLLNLVADILSTTLQLSIPIFLASTADI